MIIDYHVNIDSTEQMHQQLLLLNPKLESTWDAYTQAIKSSCENAKFAEALNFVTQIPHPELSPSGSDYLLYLPLVYLGNQQEKQALNAIQMAFTYGYARFWQFAPYSHGWGSSHDNPVYQALKPIYQNTALQAYVKSVYDGSVGEWGFNATKTPFCWFEQALLTRKNQRCQISNQKLEKNQEVYQFRFFNGSFDVPSELFVADISNFDQHPAAVANLQKYQTNSYQLPDYQFKISYAHPLINAFWQQLDEFDLANTLKLIANPPVSPTPYISHQFDEDVDQPVDEKYPNEHYIHASTGGEFINLLYVLIKCGYFNDIKNCLRELPKHVGVALLIFNDASIRQSVADLLGWPELAELYPIALKNYSQKTSAEVQSLINFSLKHPGFCPILAESMTLYEYHLYSNYHPGANWFYQEFQPLVYGKAGGLLDFLIPAPHFLPVLNEMLTQQSIVDGIGERAYDAYSNAQAHFYRTVCLHYALQASPLMDKWLKLPEYIAQSEYYDRFKSMHKKTREICRFLSKAA